MKIKNLKKMGFLAIAILTFFICSSLAANPFFPSSYTSDINSSKLGNGTYYSDCMNNRARFDHTHSIFYITEVFSFSNVIKIIFYDFLFPPLTPFLPFPSSLMSNFKRGRGIITVTLMESFGDATSTILLKWPTATTFCQQQLHSTWGGV